MPLMGSIITQANTFSSDVIGKHLFVVEISYLSHSVGQLDGVYPHFSILGVPLHCITNLLK